MRLLRPGALAALVLAAASVLSACDFGEGSSLYDPDRAGSPPPVIASVTPDGVVLAGIDEVVIEGQNFSPVPAENLVFFDDGRGNAAQGTVREASATRLVVKTPNLPNPDLRVRVSVRGAPDFSNAVAYPLVPAQVSFGEIGRTEEAFGIAAGADGALYVSLFNEGSSVGVKRIAADGTRSDYFESTFPWADLALVGTDLVGVRRIRAAFRLPEGGRQAVLAAFQPSSVALNAIAAAPDGTVYTGGNSGVLYRIGTDGSTSEAPFAGTVTGLAVQGGSLFVTGQDGSQSRVWALPIGAGGDLGSAAVVAEIPAVARSLAAAADGTLYVGTERVADPIFEVSPSGGVSPLYPGILTGPILALEYGAGSQLYAVRGPRINESNAVVPGGVLRIETRRDGAR